jgi:uncharacterized oxidoreductase
MKISGNTILITGGTSGIGEELAKRFLTLGNTVIVTGRDAAKLDRLKKEQPALHTIQSDASDPTAIEALYETVTRQFPKLNVLINNAGIMRKINLQDNSGDLKDIGLEIETNLLGVIRMVKQFLPHLKQQSEAGIVNVTSGLAFSPFPISPVYSASKAGLHSFTQSLRVQLKNTRIKVFELAPPAVETPLANAFDASDTKGGPPMMKVDKLVDHAIKGIRRDQLQIMPGFSRVLNLLGRALPKLAVRMASAPVDAMLAQTKS